MRRFFFAGMDLGSFWANAGLLVLRALTGLFLAFGHGIGKIPPGEGFVEAVGGLGFPAPIVFAWLAGIAEFLGGILLALGLLTRPAAAMIFINMSVAAFMMHSDDPFDVTERALLYLTISLAILLAGAGRYSIDALIRRKI